MAPAFSSLRHAAFFAILLLLLLTAPVLVSWTGVVDRAQVYPTMPVGTGPVSHIQREIFEDSSNLDIAFIGSSFMWSAIDAPYVQQELSRALGREAAVTVLASVWPGLDRDYAFLADLLARRRVGLVVLQFPNRNRPTRDPAAEINRVSDQPHVQAYRFFRVGDFPGAVDGLHWRGRAALYAGAVLGLPRHLLSLIRPNYTTEAAAAATLGARFEQRGHYGAPFELYRPAPLAFSAQDMIYSSGPTSWFEFHDEDMPPYQLHFAQKIAALLAEHNVPTVLLHIPQANEYDVNVVEERMNWLEATGINAQMIGVPPARMFADKTFEESMRFFASDHLNENGAMYFTRAIMPALLRIYSDDEDPG